VNPLYASKDMLPKPNQNLIENGTTPLANYYRGGEPDKPHSSLFAGRVDINVSNNDRLFFRGNGNTFLEGVSDWTYEVPAFEGLHSLDRSRYNWSGIGSWTRTAGMTVIDTQVASNQFWQDDVQRLHEHRPTWASRHMHEFCAAQNDCMLPQIAFTAPGSTSTANNYQGISSALRGHGHEPSGDNEPDESGWQSHASRRRRCAPRAAAARSRRQPLGPADVHERIHPAGERHGAADAEQSGPRDGRVHAGYSVNIGGDDSGDHEPSEPLLCRVCAGLVACDGQPDGELRTSLGNGRRISKTTT
jgi:hypothetical protein